MDSRELGLVLARQLLDVEDLHYGLWGDTVRPTLADVPMAQQRYNAMLMSHLPPPDRALRILDVGCGTGHFLCQMAGRGYLVDGVIPAAHLCRATRDRIAAEGVSGSQLFECRFENLALEALEQRYDVVLFSESFQYVPLRAALTATERLLKPGGMMLIADFFKTDAEGDGLPGDRSFRGGHLLTEFRELMRATPFVLIEDEDITRQISPSLELVDDLLMRRAKPALTTLRDYLLGHYPRCTRLAMWLLREKIDKVTYKYFSGHRNRTVFERYKTYRVMRWLLPSATR